MFKIVSIPLFLNIAGLHSLKREADLKDQPPGQTNALSRVIPWNDL
jgi:hypothetical protein